MYTACAGVGLQGRHKEQRQNPDQKHKQNHQTTTREQEDPERSKALALIRISNCIALAHDLFQYRPLATVPQGDAFAHTPVQLAKVMLHLAKVGEQLARALHELLKAVYERRVVE